MGDAIKSKKKSHSRRPPSATQADRMFQKSIQTHSEICKIQPNLNVPHSQSWLPTQADKTCQKRT